MRSLIFLIVAVFCFNGFAGGIVSFTFDDEFETQYTIAYPAMQNLDMKGTLYIEINNIGQSGYMTMSEITYLRCEGWDIEAHTVTHTPLPLLRFVPGSIIREMSEPQELLNANHFASPYGFYGSWSLEYVKRYYKSHRTCVPGLNSITNPDVYELRSVVPGPWVDIAVLEKWVDEATKQDKWLIFTFHTFGEVSINNQPPAKLKKLLEYIHHVGIPVKTVKEVLSG